MVKIIPTILVKGESEFLNKVKKYEPYFKIAQIDVLDNTLVKSKSWHNFSKIKKINSKLNYEIHLMVTRPSDYLNELSGFKKIKRVVWHIEAIRDESQMRQLLSLAKKNKWQTGLAINPETPVSKITPWLLSFNVILVMTVEPGKNGAKFQPRTLTKIKQLAKRVGPYKIAADGGISDATAPKVAAAGARILSSGSFLNQGEIKSQLTKLQNAIKEIKT
ncbi:MAG: hypothetical protein COT81_01650 [Candidatus Buchananbacteria bacterium CG10_big_fil_rev_8_21_14_0_10_42_9]|uniref:Ribulose-phosphate 3-epimerase n=1 Tax=Candidatus Buchananbacteria bacterium CG10_big_fil_rev_8_21_14_0_10_42_9 TaxID=1974526 RepID=A0A2H0W1U6_9BACT|nr:MAG: hypothetical protein COT81_01650 [Candidatus Buchananbacteria bacterium CG10_big_fil_rev_8_21_14_0_10_42_9]